MEDSCLERYMLQRKYMRLALDELDRAEELYPQWPADLVHQAAIVTEEAGELLQASNDVRWQQGDSTLADVRDEAIQTIAMALRLLINLNGELNDRRN